MTSLGRKKTESNCLANFPRTISQTSSLFRQSQHKRKIRDKNKRYCRQNKCSDLTCTKKYALTKEPKREGQLMWATRSAPQSFYACYGPDIECKNIILHKVDVPGPLLGRGPLWFDFCEKKKHLP